MWGQMFNIAVFCLLEFNLHCNSLWSSVCLLQRRNELLFAHFLTLVRLQLFRPLVLPSKPSYWNFKQKGSKTEFRSGQTLKKKTLNFTRLRWIIYFVAKETPKHYYGGRETHYSSKVLQDTPMRVLEEQHRLTAPSLFLPIQRQQTLTAHRAAAKLNQNYF